MADRFEDLRNYVAVVANGGVNAAAEALGIAKSAVSRRLGELEARLGVTLIDRTTRRFELTAIGRDYHRRAAALLASLDSLDRDVAGETAQVERIRITTDAALAPLLIPALANYISLREGLTIEIETLSGDASASREADVLILTSGAEHGGQETRRLGEFRTVLSASPAYLEVRGEPATPADLALHSGIAIVGKAAAWRLDGPVAQVFDPAMVVPDAISATAAAIRGAGLTQLPEFVISDAIGAGTLRAVLTGNEPPLTPVFASFGEDCPMIVRGLVDYLSVALASPR